MLGSGNWQALCVICATDSEKVNADKLTEDYSNYKNILTGVVTEVRMHIHTDNHMYETVILKLS